MVSGLSVINYPQAEPGVTTKQREVRCVQDSRDRQVPHPKPALVVHFEFQLGEMVCTLCFFNNGNFTCSGHPGSTFTFSDCHVKNTSRRPPTFASSGPSTETYPSSWLKQLGVMHLLIYSESKATAIDCQRNQQIERTHWNMEVIQTYQICSCLPKVQLTNQQFQISIIYICI